MQTTITVPANTDLDDCLQGAVDDYVSEHPEAAGWDLDPRWGDEDRETVVLTVPVFEAEAQSEPRITHHCSECGNQVDEYCEEHPEATVESIGRAESDPLSAGDRVEGGEPGTEDYDTGTVMSVDGDTAVVGWDSCVQTPADVDSLRRI